MITHIGFFIGLFLVHNLIFRIISELVLMEKKKNKIILGLFSFEIFLCVFFLFVSQIISLIFQLVLIFTLLLSKSILNIWLKSQRDRKMEAFLGHIALDMSSGFSLREAASRYFLSNCDLFSSQLKETIYLIELNRDQNFLSKNLMFEIKNELYPIFMGNQKSLGIIRSLRSDYQMRIRFKQRISAAAAQVYMQVGVSTFIFILFSGYLIFNKGLQQKSLLLVAGLLQILGIYSLNLILRSKKWII